jgi:hypothetical protein
MDLASVGVMAVGNHLGLDPRLTSLISVPISMIAGGFTQGLLGSGSILDGITDSLFSWDTLGGLVSVGASIGLDALGAPPILQNFLPSLLGNMVSGIGGESSSGGGGPPPPSGETIFNRIWDNITKFGGGLLGGIADFAGNIVSFGAKVLEAGASFLKEGFAKVFIARDHWTLGNKKGGLNAKDSPLGFGVEYPAHNSKKENRNGHSKPPD